MLGYHVQVLIFERHCQWVAKPIMMTKAADSGQKLCTRMRLWEFPDQYVIEPTDGSSVKPLSVNRADGSMDLIGSFITNSFIFFCLTWMLDWIGFHIFVSLPHQWSYAFTDEVPLCTTPRVPKIRTIFGVVGMLKLVAGQLNLPDAQNTYHFSMM